MAPKPLYHTQTADESNISLQILGEYYFRKGNLSVAKDIFIHLQQSDPQQYQHAYYLGKIFYRLGNVNKAVENLGQSRQINPLHRQTLLLLHHCYARLKQYSLAFECILDLYILAKEVKDQHIYYYEKRIKSTARKIEDFSTEKKASLLKTRVETLQNFFHSLEKQRGQNITQSTIKHPTEELSPDIESMKNFDEIEDEDTFPPADHSDAKNTTHEKSIVSEIQEDYDDETSLEDDIEFDIYPALDEGGPMLVQSLGDEQTMVDDHAMEDSSKKPALATVSEPETPVVTETPIVTEADTSSAPPSTHPPVEATTTSKHLRDALLQVAFLRQLNKPKLDKIQHFTSILEFAPGETIFQEGDPVFGFHILLTGDVALQKGKETLHGVSAPRIVDEDDFFRVNYRSFSCTAQTPVEILFFNKAGYQNLYQRDASTAIQFLWHFTQSLGQKIDGCIEEILLQTPTESFMEELDQKHEVSVLRKLNDQEVKVLSSLFEPIHLKRKEKIFSQQENRKYFYVVIDGRIECSHPSRHPIVIQKHEYFGEMVFCGPGYPHLFEAHVISDHATVLQISQRQLTSLTQFEESEQKFLADMLVRILANKNKELRDLLYQTRYLKNKG
ncbi:MAG: cyclic nucleotide-binding domain-containing protein [Bdellovibrionales bacterium]|nr:cyclic nucleotide-binding domain-containing protein [Bdellovibrionales bacterium]